MNFNEGDEGRQPLAAADALPPDDWDGFARSAREALYTAQRPYLTGYFRRRVAPQDVGDLVQECFRRLFASNPAGIGLLDKPGAYLARTAENILKNRARSGARTQQAAHHSFEDDHVTGPDPHDALEARDMIRLVEDAIARLNPTTRDVFLMHRFDELSYQEIANIKGMKVKRVEKHIAKALIAIRQARAAQL